MKTIQITKAGGPEVLKLLEVDEPVCAAGEIRVRVKAAGVNFADIMARQGLYQDAPPLPCVVGYEVSGVVDQVGSGVDSAKWVGKEVVALTRFKGYSECVVVTEAQIFLKPARLSFEAAAAIPVNYLTAWGLLVVMGGLKKNETILIQNSGGGVGLAAIDLARHIGARTLGTASSGKHARLIERGLDVAIDYRKSSWPDEVMKATDGRGVDLIIDPLGSKSWRAGYPLLRHCGRLGLFGASEMSESGPTRHLKMLKTALTMPFFHPLSLLNHNRSVFGLNLGHLWHENARVNEWAVEILRGYADGWVRPHVDKVFTFAEAGAAHTYMEERRNFGKVVLIPN